MLHFQLRISWHAHHPLKLMHSPFPSHRMPAAGPVARRFPSALGTSLGCACRCPSGGAVSLARLAFSASTSSPLVRLEPRFADGFVSLKMGPVVGKIGGG